MLSLAIPISRSFFSTGVSYGLGDGDQEYQKALFGKWVRFWVVDPKPNLLPPHVFFDSGKGHNIKMLWSSHGRFCRNYTHATSKPLSNEWQHYFEQFRRCAVHAKNNNMSICCTCVTNFHLISHTTTFLTLNILFNSLCEKVCKYLYTPLCSRDPPVCLNFFSGTSHHTYSRNACTCSVISHLRTSGVARVDIQGRCNHLHAILHTSTKLT